MDGQTDGRMDGRMVRLVSGWLFGLVMQMNACMCGYTHESVIALKYFGGLGGVESNSSVSYIY